MAARLASGLVMPKPITISAMCLKTQGSLMRPSPHRTAIVLRPDFAETHSKLGYVLEATGQLDEAIAAYRRSITLMPNNAKTHNNLGNALTSKGELDEAIVAYHRSIALSADNAKRVQQSGQCAEG